MKHEELYWKQRAKSFWLTEGDTNSKYFHAQATTRKKLNQIYALRDSDDQMVRNHEDMCSIVSKYFQDIFADPNNRQRWDTNSGNRLITEA